MRWSPYHVKIKERPIECIADDWWFMIGAIKCMRLSLAGSDYLWLGALNPLIPKFVIYYCNSVAGMGLTVKVGHVPKFSNKTKSQTGSHYSHVDHLSLGNIMWILHKLQFLHLINKQQ